MFKRKVKCEECKHLIFKTDAQIVTKNICGEIMTYTYCPGCRKPYDRMIVNYDFTIQHVKHNVQVSPDGTPIGYVKEIKPKK